MIGSRMAILHCLLLHSHLLGAEIPVMERIDKIKIKEAITISAKFGDRIWKDFNQVPFTMILVTDSIEFLVYHTNPPADFTLSEKDTVLHTDIFYRKRQYPVNWLATFPVNGISCIVVGTPKNTGQHTVGWIITLLHEHFHQYQYSQPGYYTAVANLKLSGGDKTGMWMLNYAFPYTDETVCDLYDTYISLLSETANHIQSKDFDKKFMIYKNLRNKFCKALTPADYSYFSFQLWQEGIARYTEYKFLELLAAYTPSSEIVKIQDYISFDEYKRKFFDLQFSELGRLELREAQRICFYAIGFAEGLILDKLNPHWRSGFFTNKFTIEKGSSRYK